MMLLSASPRRRYRYGYDVSVRRRTARVITLTITRIQLREHSARWVWTNRVPRVRVHGV